MSAALRKAYWAVRRLAIVLFFASLGIAHAASVVVIDPGHGGDRDAGSDAAQTRSSSNNTTSRLHKIREKDLTLELAKLVAASIDTSEAGRVGSVRAVLTRTTDVNLDFAERAAVAARARAACFVSIHFNAANGTASGPRGVIRNRKANPHFAAEQAFALKLANAVRTASLRYRPTPAASVQDDSELHGGRGSYLFHQLAQNPATHQIPACHLEVDFLDNPEVERTFFGERRAEVMAAWAAAIAEALTSYASR